MFTTWQREKLEHSVFDTILHPERFTLAVTSDPFPPAFNPHFDDGVEYRAVSLARGTIHMSGKGNMARRVFYDGIENGLITPDTIVVEASSGNTGPEMEMVAAALGIPMELILQHSMPQQKLERARALNGGGVSTQLVSGGGAKLARAMAQDNPRYHNGDQYRGGDGFNAYEQEHSVAPQAFAGHEDADAFFFVGGSWGTGFGLYRYAKKCGLRTQLIPVLAAGRQDISGGKNMEQTENDILGDVFSTFPKDSILTCPRDQATLLSWLSWPYVTYRGQPLMFGMSFGANVRAAFAWVEERKRAGEPLPRKVLTLGMDDFQGYTNIYLSELPDWVLNAPVKKLPPLEELFQFGRVA